MSAAPVITEPRLYTTDDLWCLPSGTRFELVRGELRPMPPPAGDEHGYLTQSIGQRIGVFVEDNDLGRCYAAETGFVLSRNPDTVLAPDFAFVAKSRLSGPPGKKYVPLVPDLVLETRSPDDTPSEVAEKIAGWLAAGVRIVWELDLKSRTLTVYRPDAEPQALAANDTLTGEDVLPGFALPLARYL